MRPGGLANRSRQKKKTPAETVVYARALRVYSQYLPLLGRLPLLPFRKPEGDGDANPDTVPSPATG